jgi:hypothetical protein
MGRRRWRRCAAHIAQTIERRIMLKPGNKYFIRTVTHYYTGELVEMTDRFLVLKHAAWIADTGRFADALTNGEFAEVEPYPDGVQVLISMGAVVDICDWSHPLPREQK